MSNKHDVVPCPGHMGPLVVAPCRALAVLLWGMAALLAAVPAAIAQDENLPAGVVRQESGYYYTIQKGDTLWDLSRRFADTPFYWPEMWQENRQIPNPHRIFPGERIRLFRRQWTEPIAAPEAKTSAPTAPEAPPCLHYAGIEAVGFIRREPVAPKATISKLDEDRSISGQFETVFVLPADGVTLLPGQQFVVYRTFEPLLDKIDKTFVGYQHYLLGVVEIADASSGLARAEVIRSFRAMRVGDKLMPRIDPKPSADILLADGKPGIAGKILRAEEDLTMFGDHAVVFINRGRDDGIATGQQYAVYDPVRQHLDPSTKVIASLPAVDFGTVVVLHTEANTATALVTRSARDIPPGALIMTPGPQR